MPITFDLTASAYAHRGLWSSDVPENSLLAFQRAAEAGFGAECDVHLSADGIPVVFHDFTLDRMTGHNAALKDLSASELSELCLGGTGQTIPTLAEVLNAMGKNPLLIELKADETTNLPDLAMNALLAAAEATGPIAIMSFSAPLISICKQISPHVMLGLLADPAKLVSDEGKSAFKDRVADIAPDFIGPNISQLCEDPDYFQSLARPVASWTVREEIPLRTCIGLGMAPIFENLPTDLVSKAMAS